MVYIYIYRNGLFDVERQFENARNWPPDKLDREQLDSIKVGNGIDSPRFDWDKLLAEKRPEVRMLYWDEFSVTFLSSLNVFVYCGILIIVALCGAKCDFWICIYVI